MSRVTCLPLGSVSPITHGSGVTTPTSSPLSLSLSSLPRFSSHRPRPFFIRSRVSDFSSDLRHGDFPQSPLRNGEPSSGSTPHLLLAFGLPPLSTDATPQLSPICPPFRLSTRHGGNHCVIHVLYEFNLPPRRSRRPTLPLGSLRDPSSIQVNPWTPVPYTSLGRPPKSIISTLQVWLEGLSTVPVVSGVVTEWPGPGDFLSQMG